MGPPAPQGLLAGFSEELVHAGGPGVLPQQLHHFGLWHGPVGAQGKSRNGILLCRPQRADLLGRSGPQLPVDVPPERHRMVLADRHQ